MPALGEVDEVHPPGLHQQFRWFGGGWKVNAELPGTAGFARLRHQLRPGRRRGGSIPCGDSVDAVAEAAGAFFKAGFTDLALVQIGGTDPEQDRFFVIAP